MPYRCLFVLLQDEHNRHTLPDYDARLAPLTRRWGRRRRAGWGRRLSPRPPPCGYQHCLRGGGGPACLLVRHGGDVGRGRARGAVGRQALALLGQPQQLEGGRRGHQRGRGGGRQGLRWQPAGGGHGGSGSGLWWPGGLGGGGAGSGESCGDEWGSGAVWACPLALLLLEGVVVVSRTHLGGGEGAGEEEQRLEGKEAPGRWLGAAAKPQWLLAFSGRMRPKAGSVTGAVMSLTGRTCPGASAAGCACTSTTGRAGTPYECCSAACPWLRGMTGQSAERICSWAGCSGSCRVGAALGPAPKQLRAAVAAVAGLGACVTR